MKRKRDNFTHTLYLSSRNEKIAEILHTMWKGNYSISVNSNMLLLISFDDNDDDNDDDADDDNDDQHDKEDAGDET